MPVRARPERPVSRQPSLARGLPVLYDGSTRIEMSRISVTESDRGVMVVVVGELHVSELRRLERVCGKAIERRRPLELVVENEGALAPAARAYVDRLRAAGRMPLK